MEPADPLDWIPAALEGLGRQGLRRRRRVGAGRPGIEVDFGTNDYLGLAADPRLADAVRAALGERWGAGASPAVTGRSELHERLEERIAAFEQTEASLVFPSGFAANSGVIPALADRGDAIYADELNHASLIDGCRLSRAERFVYRHGDADQLDALLAQNAGRHARRLIATDGLFSMGGDFAPLARLGEIAERHDAMLLVDEAHASGVWGPDGRGSVARAAGAHPELDRRVAVRIGTLSKAFGSAGGFVAGGRDLVDWLYNRARPYVFSTAPPPALAAAAIAAIDAAEAEPERRRAVQERARWLRERLADAGWSVTPSESQIVPIHVGEPERAVALSERLADRGVHAPAIRPPTVPSGQSLLRVSVTWRHTPDDLGRLLEVLGDPAPSGESR